MSEFTKFKADYLNKLKKVTDGNIKPKYVELTKHAEEAIALATANEVGKEMRKRLNKDSPRNVLKTLFGIKISGWGAEHINFTR
jgi:hypothetical protein